MSTIKPEKWVRAGEVALLVSPGFGAGWSSWTASEPCVAEFILFHKPLAMMALRKAPEAEVEEYLKELAKLNPDTEGAEDLAAVFCGGWDSVVVEWLPKGTAFKIDEYDGHEALVTRYELPYIA